MADYQKHITGLPGYRMSDGGKGYVYVLQSEDGAYKIGETLNLTNRFRRLNKKYGFDWQVVLIVPSSRCWNHEQQLHRHFRSKRCYGTQDWFYLTADDLRYIKEYVEGAE